MGLTLRQLTKHSINLKIDIFQLKYFIQEKQPYTEITISTPTLRPDNAKAELTLGQITKDLINFKNDFFDYRNITTKYLD